MICCYCYWIKLLHLRNFYEIGVASPIYQDQQHLLFAFCFSFYETFCVKLHNQWHPNDMPLLLLLLLLNLPARLAQFPWNIMQTSVCWLRLHIRAGGFDGPKIFENLSFVEILLAFSPQHLCLKCKTFSSLAKILDENGATTCCLSSTQWYVSYKFHFQGSKMKISQV